MLQVYIFGHLRILADRIGDLVMPVTDLSLRTVEERLTRLLLQTQGDGLVRPPWATQAGPAYLLLGVLMALTILESWPSPQGYQAVKESHVHNNIFGFTGMVFAGVALDVRRRYSGAVWPVQAG